MSVAVIVRPRFAREIVGSSAKCWRDGWILIGIEQGKGGGAPCLHHGRCLDRRSPEFLGFSKIIQKHASPLELGLLDDVVRTPLPISHEVRNSRIRGGSVWVGKEPDAFCEFQGRRCHRTQRLLIG